MAAQASADNRPVLAIHPGALGDLVLFGHLLRALGGADTLVASGAKSALLAGLGVAARTLDYDALPMHEAFAEAPPQSCKLPAILGSHRRLISCLGGDRRAELRLTALCGADSAAFLPVRPPASSRRHLVELWCDMLGLAWPLPADPWPVPNDWRRQATKLLADRSVPAGQPYFAIHPGAGAPEKCWPLQQFIEFGQSLQTAASVVFVIGPVEQERWDKRSVERVAERFALVCAPAPAALAGLLAGARAFIGNDSGPAHLAAAIGTPTLAVFAKSHRQFAPLGKNVRVLPARDVGALPVSRVQLAMSGLLIAAYAENDHA